MTIKGHLAGLSQVGEPQRLTGKNMTIAIILVQLVPWRQAGWGLAWPTPPQAAKAQIAAVACRPGEGGCGRWDVA